MEKEILDMLEEYDERLDIVLKGLIAKKETLQNEEEDKRSEKEISELNKTIAVLMNIHNNFTTLYSYNNILNNFEDLRTNDDEKEEKWQEIYNSLKEMFNDYVNTTMASANLTKEEIMKLDETKKTLIRTQNSLNRKVRYLTGKDLSDTNKLIDEINDKLQVIEEISLNYDTNKELVSNLESIKNTNDEKEKNDLIDDCTDSINESVDNLLDAVMAKDINDFEKIEKKYVKQVKKQSKQEQKEKAEKKDKALTAWLKRNWKKVAVIITTAAAIVSVSVAINKLIDNFVNDDDDLDKNQSQDINDTNDANDVDNKEDKKDVLDNIEKIEDPIVLALKDKGYNEYNAKLMAENFDAKTLEALLSYFTPEAEAYANVKGFNLDYLNDYEYVMNKYAITSDKAVDYVNRSHNILNTGFYDEATIDNVCDVVVAIDNKTLFFEENANLAQSFNTAFNAITSDYLFGNPTENDIAKMDALQYFAKDGSEMDEFLTRYAEIIKNILKDPKNNNHKTELYKYLSIFAYRNGINNDQSVLTNNEEFNNAADLEDYYNWFMAYNSFVAPLYPLAYPTAVELPPTTPIIPEGASEEMINEAWADLNAEWKRVEEENNALDGKMRELEELQVYMITVLNGPDFDNFCLANEGLIK